MYRGRAQGGGNVTRSQQSLSSSDTGTTPYIIHFRKYARITNTSIGKLLQVYYELTHIEAQDMANSGWDYTSSSGKKHYLFGLDVQR